MSGHLRFLTFTDLYGLDTDILITFLSILRIYTDLYGLESNQYIHINPYKSVKVKNRKCPEM